MNAGDKIKNLSKIKILSEEMFVEVQKILIEQMDYKWYNSGRKVINTSDYYEGIEIDPKNKILTNTGRGNFNKNDGIEITLNDIKEEMLYECW